ncbi:MAG: DUF2889 domain-containing protein [Candidatus Rokubacteria bacterium]|nr:DUF2889 domain-containing protein [Candidatus Rokubacteria bacterium]
MVGSPYLRRRDRYERVMEGWVDNSHADAFTLTAQIRDDDLGVEVSAVATPSPRYEIREARARILFAGPGPDDPDLAAGFGALAGARMVGGFSRRLAELTGDRRGAQHFIDAGIEVARLARQATKLPPERAKTAEGGGAWACWQLDTTGWIDLPDSCFTYSAGGKALFGIRPVTTSMVPELYCPPPGARVFSRKKVARLERIDTRLLLSHSMFDEAHGFEIRYEIDLDAGTIVRAESETPRLPYVGICDEPQKKIASLVGQPADRELRKRIQTLIGGSSGCAQLYDLTADLLKLLTLD